MLIIDNLALFKEYHPDYFEALVQISREGQGVGISMIITASQVSTIGYKLIPNFGTRIMFTCNDKSEYSALFGRSTVKPLEIPGRAICMVNKSIVEFQTALCTEADREIDRINIINNVIEEKNRLDTAKAKPVPIVPEIVEFRHLDYENHNYNMPVGIRYADISYSYINFNNQTGLVISGREKSGKTNIIKALLHILEERKEIYPYSIDVIDDEESNLEFTKKLDSLTAYTIKLDEGQELVLKAYEELKQRQQQVYDKAITLEQLPLKLLLIENSQFITKFDKDADVLSALTKIIKELKRYRIAVIFTSVPNETIAYTSNNILKLLKENKKFMVFEDMQNIKIFETNTKMLKEYQRPVEKGDCYYYVDGRINLIKTVYAE